ncbi:MAG: hypothetical protein NZ108_08825, partial [Bacteroidia bacterium]|nr:hypothetical protein [Bacteroidia bacterium]
FFSMFWVKNKLASGQLSEKELFKQKILQEWGDSTVFFLEHEDINQDKVRENIILLPVKDPVTDTLWVKKLLIYSFLHSTAVYQLVVDEQTITNRDSKPLIPQTPAPYGYRLWIEGTKNVVFHLWIADSIGKISSDELIIAWDSQTKSYQIQQP